MDEITRDPLGPADEAAFEPQTNYPAPSSSHLAHLWNNVHSDPTLTDDFDAKFGPGAAAQYLAKEKAKALPWPKQNRVAFEASPQTYSTRDVGAAMVNQSPLTEQMDQFVERENYRLDAERERASLSSIRSFALTAKGYEPAKSWIDLELDQAQKSVDRWTGELRGRVDAPDGSDLLRDDAGAPITYGDPALDNLASYLAQAQERLKIARQIKEDLDKQTPRSINPPSRLKIGMELAELERDIAADEEVLATADMGPAKAASFEYDLQQKRKRYAQLEKAAEQAMQAPALADDDPRATWLLDAARGTARGFAGMLQSGASAMQYWSKELGSMQMAGVLASQALEELGKTIEEGTSAPPVDALDVLTMDPRTPGYLTKMSRLSADAIGSAIGSSGVVLLGAAAAHVGGSAVGGPVVGGIAGKTAAVAMNIAVGQGEFRNQLIQAFKDEGRDLPDDATVDKLLLFYGSAIGMVETASDIWILNGLGASPTAAAKQAISKSLIKALAKGVAKGAMTEGLEEFAQEWISVIGVQHAKGEGLSQQEFHQKLADSIRAASMGAIGGAGLGLGKGAVDVLKARQQTTSPTVQPGIPEAKPKAEPTSPIVESGLEAGLAEAQQDPSIQPPENEKEPAKLNQQDIADFVGIWEYVREQEKKQPDDPTLNRQELAKLKGELADMGLDGIETAADVRKALEAQTLDATIDTKPPSIERYGEPLEGLSEREQATLGELADEMGIADKADDEGVSLADQVQSQAESRFGDDPAGAEDALQAAAIRRMAEMRREGISFAPEFDALLDKLVEKEASSAVERLEREQAAQQVESLNRMLGLADLSPEAAAAIRSEVIDEAKATGKPVLDVAKARSDALLEQARSAGLQRYLEAGGSLDTADLPALARGLGVAQKALPALLARAQEEGLLRQDKRGRWLRGPKAPDIRTDLAQALSERPGNADLASVFEEAAARARQWAPAGTRFRPFASPTDLPTGLREQVEAAEQQTGAKATGFAHAGDVWISAYLLDPTAKMGHEVVHALRERGLITDAEINIIAARVRRAGDLFSKADRERYLQVYRGDRAKVREEEAAAGIEAYLAGYDFGPQVNGIIGRILQTLERLRNALRGRGFQSFDDVVNAFLEGKMAARAVAAPAVRADQTAVSAPIASQQSAQPVPAENKGPSDWQIAVETWQFVREAKRLPAPTRLTEFLRQRGGLQEDAGEIRNMLGDYNKRPGLVSKRGSTLDDATYAAWEAGYLPGEERPEINDLLNALDEDLNGRPITSRFDADIVEAKAAAAEAERELERLGVANARSEQQVKDAIIKARFSGRSAAEADGGIETPIRPDLEEAAAAEEARARLAGPDWQALAPGWDVERDGPLFSFGDEVQKYVDALRGRPLDGDIIPPGKIAEAETWFGQYALRVLGDRLHVDESSGLLRVRSPSAAGAKPSLADRLAALGLPPVGPGRGGAGQAQGAQRRGALEQAIGRDYAAIEAITGLKLDAESVEARAKAQLFNVDGWHGTFHNFASDKLSDQIPRGMGPGMDFGFHFAIGRPAAANFIVGAPDNVLAKLQWKIGTGAKLPNVSVDANILPLKIRANKPLRLTDPGAWVLPGNWVKAVEGYKGAVYEELKEHAYRIARDRRMMPDDVIYGVRDIMEKHGYDSVIYRNRVEDAGRDSMFVWHPERQVRSKFDLFHPKAVDSPGLLPSLNMLGDDVRFSLENVQPEIDALGYISKALEVARGLRQNKGTPEQMLAQLKKAGVKEAEIEATGLADLLTGKAAVTKAEIVTHLIDNRVRLLENVTTREFDTAEVEARVQQHIATEAEIVGRWYNMDLDEWADGDVPIRSIGGVLQFIEATTGERIEYADTPERNEDLLNDAGMTFMAGRVDAYDGHHFTLITAPDGRTMIDSSRLNYPQKGQVYPSRTAAIEAIDEEARALVAAELDRQRLQIREDVIRQMTEEEDPTAWSRYTLDPDNPTYTEVVLHLPAKDRREDAAILDAVEGLNAALDRRPAPATVDFRSGHFPQPNIIGHMMLSTVQHNGQPTLLLDQIQSDWGQKLRDGGVRDEAKIAEWKKKVADATTELETAAKKANEELDRLGVEKAFGKPGPLSTQYGDANQRIHRTLNEYRRVEASGDSARIGQMIGLAAEVDNIREKLDGLERERFRLQAELKTYEQTPGGHPLVNTTDQWLNTTLRRAIRIAVDKGAAYIAIPSGSTVLSYNPGDDVGMMSFYGQAPNRRAAEIMRGNGETGRLVEIAENGTEGIVPKNLRKLLEKLDKATPAPDVVERVDTPSQGMKGEGFTIFRLTDKVRQEVGRGQVMFSLDDPRYSFGQRRLPRPGLGEPTRSLDELITDLGDALNVTVRVGRLAPKFSKSSGQINVKTGVIRLKSPANLEALADLGGKALLDRYGQDMHRLLRRHVAEMSAYLPPGPNGLPLAPDTMSVGPYVMGEFFRSYITNAAHAENTSPNFYREFEAFLDQREPRMLAHLQDIQANTEEWKATPSAGVVSSNLHSAYQPGALERVYKGVISAIGNAVQANRTEGRDAAVESLKADVVDPVSTMAGKAYIAMADRLASIDWLRDSLLEVGRQNAERGLIPLRPLNSGEKLAIGQAEFDPGKLARLAQNAYQAGHMALMRGIRPYKGLRHGGPSWRDAMVMAMGGETEADWTPEKLKAFDTYLWSHNMIERWKDHADGKLTRFPDKISAADHRQTVQDLAAAYPQFEPAAQLLYGYLANMRDLWFQSGLLKKETYDEMKTRRRYVPAMRVMDDNGKPDGARSPKADNLLRRFGGSERDGISPTEMIAKFTYELHYMVANNDIIRAIDTIARAVGPGGAKFAERLPASRVEALKFDTAELLKAIGKEIGIDEIDALFHLKALEEQFDTKLDSETVLFRRGEINERGETIIYLFEDGKKVPIKLHEGEIGREIYNAITGLGVDKINAFVNLMAKPSQYLRFGVTALDPAFAVRNFARDQLSASTVIPGYLAFWSSLKNVPASFRRAYQGSYTESMEQLESFGGITGSSLGADIYQSRIKRDVQSLRERGIRVRDLKGWYEWIGLTETATRLGVFQVTRQRAIDDGMNEYSSVIEAAATANDLLDWTRRGANTSWILRLVPFLSSWLQGWDKLRRTAIGESNTFRNVQEAVSPYLKATEGQPLSIVEQKAFTASMRMWLHVGVIFPIVSLSLSLLYRDDEEYQEIPEHFRETHWMFKAGGFWWRYPKPFEMAVGSYLVERGLEAGLQRDPYQLWRFMTGAGELLKPTSTVPGLQLIIDQWANKARFSGAPIVSERLQAFEPWRQYEITTSELAKYIGYGTGASPVRVDHAINSVFGGFGGLIQKASNQVLPGLYGPRQQTKGEDIFQTMRMVVDPAQSSQSRKEFMERFAARTSDYQAKAKTYADEMDASSPVLADLALKNATPDQKAYALLQYHGSAYDKGQHPLSRAQEVLTITRAITREMQDSKLRNTDDLPFSPSDQRTVQEMFRQIQMREARNAMIVIGEKGYKGLKIMPVDGVLRELEAKAPEIFEVFERRMRKGKVADFDEVRNGWPTLKAEILAPGYAEEHPHKVKQR